MTASEIRELDPQTVERIAAGEVVERPASVVKELVENSIDAGATRLTVSVANGGIDGITVRDDGQGMTRDELERAVEKHTTSKIRDIDDLESGVATLGFRGEALHAIGAVSRLTITTNPQPAGDATELTVEGGDVTQIGRAGQPPGTSVEVEDLFYNVPARRKYLKQPSTEFAHVHTVTTSYALANPGVAVTLEHDSRETFATTGSGDLREAVMSVYGREVASAMRTVSDESLPAGPLHSVSGMVSHPETNRASREYLSTFVNGRYVTANVVRDAVVDAYDTQLAPDRYPFAVLYLEVDPATVDVNVHPRKLEVRFAEESAVRKQVEHAVENTLIEDGLVRSSAPRGQSAPEQTEISPDTAETESDDQSNTDESVAPTETAGERPASGGAESSGRAVSTRSDSERGFDGFADPEADGSVEPTENEDDEVTGKFQDSGTQTHIAEPTAPDRFERLPRMRVLGQYEETYIVAETDDGLVLVDQHAADERVNYERLKDSVTGETPTQALAEPVEVELTAREADLFEAHTDALSRLGFRAELVDERTAVVRTVPAIIAESAGPELIRDVLAEFVQGTEQAADTVDAAVEDLLADMACYPSITGNTSLTEGSVVELLSELDGCDNPYACPHGRPVIVEFDSEEIENRFERDYPGHH